MDLERTCKACHSPVLAGTHYCTSCLLVPAFPKSSDPISPPVSLSSGATIDRFKIVECLGVGGFSEVYSVIDSQSRSRTLLAIKVMRMGLNSTEFLSRFEQEHHLLRRLEDPGIVRVYESGICEDGRPYFVMEQIDGLRITDYSRSEQLSLESRVELFIAVRRAVHHAHQKGIIHRDLKPANILVSDRPGVATPVVIDFGLAKAVQCWNTTDEQQQGSAWVTQLGISMGTPGYISPEQADGSEDIDVLSDIFSLGVVLYELLAEVPPWPHEIWKKIPHAKWSLYKSENAPAKPSVHNTLYASGRRLDRDLDTICIKALETNRAHRYESVSQLATDLSHWLMGDPISARPPSLTYRLSKLMSRYRWQSATLIASLVTCLVTTIFGVTLAIRERSYSAKLAVERTAAIEAKIHANELREIAIHERQVAERTAYASNISMANLQIANGQPYLAERNLNTTQSFLRGWEWNYLHASLPRPLLSLPTGLDAPVSVAVSANHTFAAVCDGRAVSRIDLKLAKATNPCQVDARGQHVAISNDGKYVATLAHQTSSSFVNVYQFSAADGAAPSIRLTKSWSRQVHPDTSLAFEFTTGEPVLIVAEGNGPEPVQGSLLRLSVATGEVLSSIDLKRWKLAEKGLVIGQTLAVARCSFDRLAVVSLPKLSIKGFVYGMFNNVIEDFELSDDETRVLFAQSGAVYECEWNQADRAVSEIVPNEKLNPRFKVDDELGEIHRLNRNRNGQWMAITDTHCVVEGSQPVPLPIKNEKQLVGLRDGTYAAILPHGTFEIRPELPDIDGNRLDRPAVKTLPEARWAVVAPSSDYCLYQTWSRQNLYKCSIPFDGASEIYPTQENKKSEWSRLPIFHPDGTAIIIAPSTSDEPSATTLATLRWESGEPQRDPLPVKSIAWSAAASPDATKLFVGTMQGVLAINWSSRTVLKEWTLAGGPFVVMPMNDNSGVFAIGVDHIIQALRFEAAPETSPRFLEDGPGVIPAQSDYFVGDQILAISDSSSVRIFSLGKNHTEIERVPTEAGVTAIRFSDDGKRLAVATSNRKIAVWDWKGKHRLIELGTRGTCSSMDFSRDGHWLINTDYNPSLTIR